jgi:hypothetical protein
MVPASDGTPTNPTIVANPEFQAWRRSDRLLRGWITGTLSEDTLSLVIGLDSSQEVWNALHIAFAHDSQEREFHLTQKLQTLKKGTSNMTEYVREFKLICDDLAAIGKPIESQKKVFWLLNGLGSEYKAFVTTMLKPPTPTYTEIIPLLQSHETWLSIHEPQTSNNQTVAFVTHKGHNFSQRGRTSHNFSSRGRGFTQSGQHNKGTRAPNLPPNVNNQGPCTSTSRDHGRFFTSSSLVPCQICGKKGHAALRCWHRFNQSFAPTDIPQALAAITITNSQDREWFPDTAASNHMTSDSGTLINLKPYIGHDSVMVGNGDLLKISHIGDTFLNTTSGKMVMKKVLLVPELKKNLLYVSQFTDDYPCKVEFSNVDVVIKDKETQNIMIQGSRRGNLYALDDSQPMAFFSNRHQSASERIWHWRLGHPQPKVVQFLHKNNRISVASWNKNNSICDSCQIGKTCRLPFISTRDCSTKPISIIHSDLWGPSPVVSRDGYRYYFIFIDECTRFTWLYPLRRKYDFFHCFLTFQSMVERQFD